MSDLSFLWGEPSPFITDAHFHIQRGKVAADVYHGNCASVLVTIPDNTVDLIITSPPYASQRQNTYGGTSPEEYVDWFLPISTQLFRVLKPDGS